MLENLLVIAVVGGAAIWMLFWLRSTSRNGGCSCGKGPGGAKTRGCCGGTNRCERAESER